MRDVYERPDILNHNSLAGNEYRYNSGISNNPNLTPAVSEEFMRRSRIAKEEARSIIEGKPEISSYQQPQYHSEYRPSQYQASYSTQDQQLSPRAPQISS